MFVTIATTIAVALAPAPSQAAATPVASAAATCSGRSETVDQARRVHALVCLVNNARAVHGLRRLRSNASSTLAAGRFAKDMVKRTYFNHMSPGGSTPVSRVRAAGYKGRRIGETIAWAIGSGATPAATVHGWLHSPPHRRILLDRRMRDLGVGLARGAPVKIRSAGVGATVVIDVGA